MGKKFLNFPSMIDVTMVSKCSKPVRNTDRDDVGNSLSGPLSELGILSVMELQFMCIYPDLMADLQEQGFLSLLLSFNSIAEIAKDRRETGLQKLGGEGHLPQRHQGERR